MIETDITRAAKEGLDQLEAKMREALASGALDAESLMLTRLGLAIMRPCILAFAAEKEANADPLTLLNCFSQAVGSVMASVVFSTVTERAAREASALVVRQIGGQLVRALEDVNQTRVEVSIEGVGHA